MVQDSRKHCSCHVITVHFFTHGSGAVVLIRIAGRKSGGRSGRVVVVSGNTLVDGRPREHNGNSTEFKFVFKSYSGVVARTTYLVALMSSLSKMRTGTSERCAAEFWLIPMECGWVKCNQVQGQEQEQGARDKERQKQRKGQREPEEWRAHRVV